MRDTAIAAALAAGEIQKSHYGALLRVEGTKRHDVKLEADRLCEEAIVSRIRTAFPDHSILTEESGATELPGAYRWVIDPLDGTVNFFYGIPYFCTSIACYRVTEAAERQEPFPHGPEAMGEPVIGVIYAPPADELFVAEAGRGATCNGEPIRPSDITDIGESMISVGFGKLQENLDVACDAWTALTGRARKLRCLGSAGWDISNVACGRLSAFFERGLRTWDVAAARIVLEEAGGVFDAFEYEEGYWNVIASCPGICRSLRSIVRQAGQ